MQQRYDEGVLFVEKMVDTWRGLQTTIDTQRHQHVSQRLAQQLDNAREWREVCLNYFGQFASRENS